MSKQDKVNTQTHSVESRAVFHYSALAKSAIDEVYTTQINTPYPPLNKRQCPLADLDSHWSISRRMSENMAREVEIMWRTKSKPNLSEFSILVYNQPFVDEAVRQTNPWTERGNIFMVLSGGEQENQCE